MQTPRSFHTPGAAARVLQAAIMILTLAATVAVTAGGAPQPAGVPYRWQLDFKPGPLRLHVDRATGDAYWYFTYLVTNKTDQDLFWAPVFTLYTDAGEIRTSGRDVPGRVTEDLLALLGNELLLDQNSAFGDILQGPAHAREGLIVWPAREMDVDEVSIFIAGLSGETAVVEHPVTGERILLRKTLHRKYLIPGNVRARGSDPAPLVAEEWVMR